jgi:hypothetical protein
MPGTYNAPAASLTGTILLNDGGGRQFASLTTAPNSVINMSGFSPN